MIKYRKKITIKHTANGDVKIQSDRGDVYDTFAVNDPHTPWTTWWNMNHHSNLREWQKDVAKMFADKFSDLTLFVVYKKGHGHNQPHDIALFHSEQHKIWLMSTTNDFWVESTDLGQFDLDVSNSAGSVLDKPVRDNLYEVIDQL